jgi:hypothetical protein
LRKRINEVGHQGLDRRDAAARAVQIKIQEILGLAEGEVPCSIVLSYECGIGPPNGMTQIGIKLEELAMNERRITRRIAVLIERWIAALIERWITRRIAAFLLGLAAATGVGAGHYGQPRLPRGHFDYVRLSRSVEVPYDRFV